MTTYRENHFLTKSAEKHESLRLVLTVTLNQWFEIYRI